ncbi:MAG: HU family DNA-binding protein, partial [Deltaproteobacteria bacterium]|nr:HU family DNA-binding protein [Deltaproteobacteria bacterium]MBW2341338.1 HU family DNA-binding protein [Deltaproteobacteria bacterium]
GDLGKRRGRNPQTGDDLMLGERRVVTFRCSGRLREKINGGGGSLEVIAHFPNQFRGHHTFFPTVVPYLATISAVERVGKGDRWYPCRSFWLGPTTPLLIMGPSLHYQHTFLH